MKEYFEFTDVELTEEMMNQLADPRFYGPDYDEDVAEERYD